MDAVAYGICLYVAACSSSNDGTVVIGDGTGGGGVSGTAGKGGAETGAGGGTSAGGASGSAGMPGESCAPGETISGPFFSSRMSNCYWGSDPSLGMGVPNRSKTDLRDIDLGGSIAAGQKYVMSLAMNHVGPESSIELWGTDAECGSVRELLWWAPLETKHYCAEFTPTAPHSHLVMAWRTLAARSGGTTQIDSFTLCPTGACSSAADGQGLVSGGAALSAPVGPYSASGSVPVGSDGVSRGRFSVGRDGVIGITGAGDFAAGDEVTISGGFFRMNDPNPFSDAWYCIGAGTLKKSSEPQKADFSFTGITKLGDCRNTTGTETATLQYPQPAIQSSFPELSGSVTQRTAACVDVFCFFSVAIDGRVTELFTIAETGPVYRENVVRPLASAAWLLGHEASSPVQLSCASSGDIVWSTDDKATVNTTSMSAFVSCPGAPVSPNTFEGELGF